jgi:hypothetical protein
VVLQEAGLLRLHEPVPLLRLGHNTEGDFAPKLQQAAQVPTDCRALQGTWSRWRHQACVAVNVKEPQHQHSLTCVKSSDRLLRLHEKRGCCRVLEFECTAPVCVICASSAGPAGLTAS